MTTEALMNICGSVKITLTERFREEVKTEDEWQSLVETQLEEVPAYQEPSSVTIKFVDPNQGIF